MKALIYFDSCAGFSIAECEGSFPNLIPTPQKRMKGVLLKRVTHSADPVANNNYAGVVTVGEFIANKSLLGGKLFYAEKPSTATHIYSPTAADYATGKER